MGNTWRICKIIWKSWYEPNIITFNEDQLRTLLFHELLHVKIDISDDGTEKYGTNPHDIEDFREIIDRFGMDWDKPEWSEVEYGE